jgi:AmiR/NasT family two-component response regulator
MKLPQDYVLILDEQQKTAQKADLPHISDKYSFVVASSAEHAVEAAQKVHPCLVILVGQDRHWFENQVRVLRHSSTTPSMTIVALTDSTAPHWSASQEALELDGFLVKPLTDDILVSLVQSAIIKQSYQ